MAFLTGFRNWWKPKKGQEMTQLYDTKLANTVSEGKRVAEDLRKTAKIFFLKISRVTDLAETIKILNQASCKLDDRLSNKQAEYDLAIVRFLKVDKEYNNYITLQESDKTNKNIKIKNNETR
jgi:hypothetical protein